MELKLSPLEKKLFQGDKPDLAHGALIASGVRNRGELDAYLDMIEVLCQGIEPELPSGDYIERAKALFDWLWESKPHRYEFRGNFRLTHVLESQLDPGAKRVGNCLGLTLLYNVLAGRFGLSTRSVYLDEAHGGESHVFSILYIDGSTIDIDNIYPIGFDYREHLGDPLRVTWDDAGLIADIYHSTGWALHEDDRLNDAIQSYSKAIRLNPEYEKAYLNRGIALSMMGREDEAMRDFEQQV